MSSRATKIDKPPTLPPKKIPPDPDYEIIEFSNEQYSNAQPIKTTSIFSYLYSHKLNVFIYVYSD